VNIAGEWREGFTDPLWIMTNPDAEEGLGINQGRMKIEEAFKDSISLLYSIWKYGFRWNADLHPNRRRPSITPAC
jgi:hypothetical protein